MPNTGIKVVLTLQQVDDNTGIPTGLTKPNIIGDPDYIAPYLDLVDCPIVASLQCPVTMIATGYTDGSAEFEFTLESDTTSYPGLDNIKVRIMNSVPAEVASVIFSIPNSPENYFYGSVVPGTLTASTTYTLRIQYRDSSDNILAGGDCIATSGTFTTDVTP